MANGKGKKFLVIFLVASTFFFILAGLFFLSPNITGNAVANLSVNLSSVLGTALVLLSVSVAALSLKL